MITFGAIIMTFVGQGLLLPAVVQWLGLARGDPSQRRLDQFAAEGRVAPEVAGDVADAARVPDAIYQLLKSLV